MNYIALLGWSPKSDREIFTLPELSEVFKISGLNKSAAVFDYDKLKWMNAEYIKAMAPEKFAECSKEFANIAGTAVEPYWNMLAGLLQPRTEILSEIPGKIAFLLEQPQYDISLFNNKKSKCNPEISLAILQELRGMYEALENWTPEAITELVTNYAQNKEMKLGLPMWALRIAVSGTAVTPGGPGEIMTVLGKTESIKRIDNALKMLQ